MLLTIYASWVQPEMVFVLRVWVYIRGFLGNNIILLVRVSDS